MIVDGCLISEWRSLIEGGCHLKTEGVYMLIFV